MQIRRAADRGHADHGWLRSHHTFSFADYYDPLHMSYRALRVLNEDQVQPGMGFPSHPHRDMEIITYVLAGALQHQDSLGTGSVIRPGEVQRMSAGTGVTHSEINASKTEPVHFLQIWVVPDHKSYQPSYEQKPFTVEERQNRLRLVASPDGKDGSVTVHQDVRLYAVLLDAGQTVHHDLVVRRHAWVHVARGRITLDGTALAAGDAAAVDAPLDKPVGLTLVADEPAEVLLFDLA